jgi:choline dehydrogenase-like flavoprotein
VQFLRLLFGLCLLQLFQGFAQREHPAGVAPGGGLRTAGGKNTNPFIGAGGNAVAVDDFNGDHYDHGPLGFVGGSPAWCNQTGTKPISGIPVPDGMPSWGKGWKKAVKDNFTNTVSFDVHGTNMAYRDCYLDLDPDYRDQYGQPLLRFTFNRKDNDIKMIRYVTNEMLRVARAMNPRSIQVVGKNFGDHFDARPYQTTHLAGGTIMGRDRNTSLLNRTCRVGTSTICSRWDRAPFRKGSATIRPARSQPRLPGRQAQGSRTVGRRVMPP